MRTGFVRGLACIAMVIAAAGWSAAEDVSVVRLTRLDGTATVKKYGVDKAVSAKEGQIIERGDVIETADKSSAVLTWSNGGIFRLYPGGRISLEGVTFDLDKKMEGTVITLEKGRVFVKAQVPEHLFCEFQIAAGAWKFLSQGAEFALTYDPTVPGGSATLWTILGRVVTDVNYKRLRIDDGRQLAVSRKAGRDTAVETPMSAQTRAALAKVSDDLGGSLLKEEEGKIGGPLKARIGGVRARRGTAPYKVQFKALISGGSGKMKKIEWDFGDGTTAAGRQAEHTFTQGLYVVILRIEDENGQKSSAQINISAEEDCNC